MAIKTCWSLVLPLLAAACAACGASASPTGPQPAIDATMSNDASSLSDGAAGAGDATATTSDAAADGLLSGDASTFADSDSAGAADGGASSSDGSEPCVPGQAACDDENACTLDSCDASSKQCGHTPLGSGNACNDGNPCTAQDQCAAGKCAGVVVSDGTACDTNSGLCFLSLGCKAGVCAKSAVTCKGSDPCAVYSCDPAQGCVSAPAGDGSPCTAPCLTNATCSSGSCVGATLADGAPCDDGGVCTLNDLCKGGTCQGTASPKGTPCPSSKCWVSTVCDGTGACAGTWAASACDDGNTCTADNCDSATGQCNHTPLAEGAYCSTNQGCATGSCFGGSCATDDFKVSSFCDDNNPCTAPDKCQTGDCIGVPNAAVCDDKDACTADACTVATATTPACSHTPIGSCTVASSFEDTMACGSTSWTISPVPVAGKPGWAIDAYPLPGWFSPGCSLNFNNNVNYDDGGPVSGTATSAPISLDASAPSKLAFWSYNGINDSPDYDTRTVSVSDDGFGTSTQTWKLDDASQNKWTLLTFDLSAWKGKSVVLRFGFVVKDSFENSGAGWFIDDVRIWHSSP